MWEYLIILVVTTLVVTALAPKLPNNTPTPSSAGDFDVPVAEEGRPIPVVFGTVRITGPNVLWYGDLSSEPIYSSGGSKK